MRATLAVMRSHQRLVRYCLGLEAGSIEARGFMSDRRLLPRASMCVAENDPRAPLGAWGPVDQLQLHESAWSCAAPKTP